MRTSRAVQTIEGQISIYCDRDHDVEITIEDKNANTTIVVAKMSHTEFVSALGGLCNVNCSLEVGNLDVVGKVHECKKHEFALGPVEDIDYKNMEGIAKAKAQETAPDGWVADAYFNSQDSYFKRGGDLWARCVIRRWVDKDD